MKRLAISIFLSFTTFLHLAAAPIAFAAPCDASAGPFEIFPRWYKYLTLDGECNVTDFQPGDVGLIAIAIIEILLRVAGFVAFIFVTYAGFKYVLSRGNPSEAAKARQTLIDAIIGIIIATSASVLVSFLGRTLSR